MCLDFDVLFPEMGLKFTTMFSEFKSKVQPFLLTAIKSSTSINKELQLDTLSRIDKLDTNTSDFLVLYYLPYYLKPTKHVKLIDRSCKPTIAESQKFFILLLPVCAHIC